MTYLERSPVMPLMVHVAAAHENRGRVVLAAISGQPHPVAVDAAFMLARAFDASVECQLIACPEVAALTAHPFAREVTYAGRIAPLAAIAVADHQTAEIARARRVISTAAENANVRLTTSVASDSLADALARACALQGPWNIVALAEPIAPADATRLPHLLDRIDGATGIVCVGPDAIASCSGPVAILVKDSDALPQMLRAAERLALAQRDTASGGIMLLLAGATSDDTAQLEAHVRLMLPGGQTDTGVNVTIAETSSRHGTPAEIAEALRRLDPAWVITRASGAAGTPMAELAAVLSILRAPLLLVR